MSQLSELNVTATRQYVERRLVSTGDLIAMLFTRCSGVGHTEPWTEFTLTLPHPSNVKAGFSKEGFSDKLAKLFKHELQTGDRDFDRAVYISTDTPDETAALLRSEELRASIMLTVDTGGPIQINGDTVKMIVYGRQDGDDAAVTTLCRALLTPAA